MNNENALSAADVAAVMNGGRGGFSNSGFGGDGVWWLLILFLFAFMGNWGNNGNNGGFGNAQFVPWMMGSQQNGVQQGFDQAAIMNGLNGIQASLASAEVSRCNAQTNVLQALNTNQAASLASMNSLAMGLQNCCCENRAGLADLKYTVATENCADRAAVSDGIRDVIAAGNANTQAILDKLCALELDGVKQRNADLLAENTALKSDNSLAAQTATLLNRLAPNPIPAYAVQNPSCCANNGWNNCGCNG